MATAEEQLCNYLGLKMHIRAPGEPEPSWYKSTTQKQEEKRARERAHAQELAQALAEYANTGTVPDAVVTQTPVQATYDVLSTAYLEAQVDLLKELLTPGSTKKAAAAASSSGGSTAPSAPEEAPTGAAAGSGRIERGLAAAGKAMVALGLAESAIPVGLDPPAGRVNPGGYDDSEDEDEEEDRAEGQKLLATFRGFLETFPAKLDALLQKKASAPPRRPFAVDPRQLKEVHAGVALFHAACDPRAPGSSLLLAAIRADPDRKHLERRLGEIEARCEHFHNMFGTA